MVGATGHVGSKSRPLAEQDVFGGFHRTADEHVRAFDHRRRPRGQADALLLLVREFAGEKTVDVVRVVSEHQQRRMATGCGWVMCIALARACRLKPVEQDAGSGRVESGPPEWTAPSV